MLRHYTMCLNFVVLLPYRFFSFNFSNYTLFRFTSLTYSQKLCKGNTFFAHTQIKSHFKTIFFRFKTLYYQR